MPRIARGTVHYHDVKERSSFLKQKWLCIAPFWGSLRSRSRIIMQWEERLLVRLPRFLLLLPAKSQDVHGEFVNPRINAGTIRREFLDHVLIWNVIDLERKLEEFRNYYNESRVHQ